MTVTENKNTAGMSVVCALVCMCVAASSTHFTKCVIIAFGRKRMLMFEGLGITDEAILYVKIQGTVILLFLLKKTNKLGQPALPPGGGQVLGS